MEIINEQNFNSEISNGRVLVDFYADWCGPCKMQGVVLEEAKSKIDIPIKKINVDNAPNISRQYGVMSIPTLILFEAGKEIKRNVGFLDLDSLIEFTK